VELLGLPLLVAILVIVGIIYLVRRM